MLRITLNISLNRILANVMRWVPMAVREFVKIQSTDDFLTDAANCWYGRFCPKTHFLSYVPNLTSLNLKIKSVT